MPESAASPVKEGDLLAGKYRVEHVLGVGGMGIVVAARHEQLDQRVAIKFVRDEALGNDEAVARFLREARAAVKLRSEHAAKVLDVGTLESGAPYMVMEFLEGSDLGAVLGERGPLPVEVAAAYVVQACEAVAEAHAAGIVHRDLKPQNLFLARTVGGASRVKVLDFGVSKTITGPGSAGSLTQTRSMLGSPLYMSPEQMRSSRDVDARSDVWALGVVLFELLTQRWPFEAETMPELCLKVVTEPPQSLLALRPDVPPAMIEVVERCLKRDPAQRYADGSELASALEPLAPPESRITVERARMAMGATGPRPPLPSMPTVASAATPPARLAPTPAAWGSGKGEAGAPSPATKKRSAGVWIGAGIAIAGIATAGALFLRGGHADAPPPVPPTVAAQAVASPPPPVTVALPATTVAPAAPAPTEAPTASAAASSVPGATTTATAASARAPATPPPAVPAVTVAKPGTPPGRSPGATKPKAKANDDDIPSLR